MQSLDNNRETEESTTSLCCLNKSSNLPTPIRVNVLTEKLHGYDPEKSAQLIKGFTLGFDIGFRGAANNNISTKNHKSALEHPDIVLSALEIEIKSGRMVGPFDTPPFGIFQINPIGLVPKKTPGSFRLICDLSSPKGQSINDGIGDTFAKVNYSSLHDAIQLILKCGPNVFLAKSDIEKAFRLIPIHPDQHHLLCIQWEQKIYVDRCLPMGARSACQLFEEFSTALQAIAHSHGIQNMTHYLDDFLFVNISEETCEADLGIFIELCTEINVPLAKDKTVGPSQVIQYLGFEIDTRTQSIRLPSDKLEKCKSEILWLLERSKCTLHDFQSLLGLLNFACAVIVPGRAFLQRLYGLTAGIAKPHFYIRLTEATKEDLRLWLQFLESYNGVVLYKDELFLSPATLHIFSDASQILGCGAVFGCKWLSVPWPSQWWLSQNITFLELVPIYLAIECWATFISNSSVVIHTDNMSLMHVLNTQSSKEKLVMCLVRKLVLSSLRTNFLFKAVHIQGKYNRLSDSLSRLQVEQFRLLHPRADPLPTPTPELPVSGF